MSIVDNIRWLCSKNKTSIPKLEKELKFGNGAIYNWDKSSPSIGNLQKVAKRFNVSLEFLSNGFDKEIIEIIKTLSKTDNKKAYFPEDILKILHTKLAPLKSEYYDVPLDLDPMEMIGLIKEFPVTAEFKESFLNVLKTVKDELYSSVGTSKSTPKFIELEAQYLRRIPLVGRVAAGNPILAIENNDDYIVVDTRINNINGNSIDEYFVLEVSGQSMEPTIHDGEMILVKKQPIVELGQIGVFRCNGDEATVKRFSQEGNKIFLIPDNKQFPVQEYTTECECIGQVIESVRRKIK